jgi:hypothetical protein
MTVDELLAPCTPEVRAIAEKMRALVLEVFPGAVEQVDSADKLLAYGTGVKLAQQVFYIAPFKAHANLGFLLGTVLPDPHGLLEGTGKRLRHVKLRTLDDVDRPELRELMLEGVARSA